MSHISPELAYAAEDADLVMLEGMVRLLPHSTVLNSVKRGKIVCSVHLEERKTTPMLPLV